MLKKITKADRERLEDKAFQYAKYSNVNKFGFSPSMITDMFIYLFKKTNGKFNPDESVCLAADYKERGSVDYYEVTALINLMKKHLPKEIIANSSRKGMKIMIMGEAAEEIFSKIKINWGDTHITTAGAKVSISLPITNKLKCFKGEKIADEIKRIKNYDIKNNIKGKAK